MPRQLSCATRPPIERRSHAGCSAGPSASRSRGSPARVGSAEVVRVDPGVYVPRPHTEVLARSGRPRGSRRAVVRSISAPAPVRSPRTCSPLIRPPGWSASTSTRGPRPMRGAQRGADDRGRSRRCRRRTRHVGRRHRGGALRPDRASCGSCPPTSNGTSRAARSTVGPTAWTSSVGSSRPPPGSCGPDGLLVLELGGTQDGTLARTLAGAGFDHVETWSDEFDDVRGLAARRAAQRYSARSR